PTIRSESRRRFHNGISGEVLMRSRLSQRRRITRLVTTVALDEIEQSNLPCLHAAISTRCLSNWSSLLAWNASLNAVQRSQRILVHSRRLVRISKLIETSNTIIFESR